MSTCRVCFMRHVYDETAFGSRERVVCHMQHSLKPSMANLAQQASGTVHRLESGCMLTASSATLTCFLSRLASLLLACLTVLELRELAV